MGETLTITGQRRAYTLADRGTWLATDKLDLELLVAGGADLLNSYHVLVVKGENANGECAERFSDWITHPRSRRRSRVWRCRLRGALLRPSRGERMDAVLEVLGPDRRSSRSAPPLIALAIGVPLGTWLALARLRRQAPRVAATVNTGMAVPTVVVGLVVALALWRSGPLGDLELIYTLRGMVIAQVLIAAPLITGITMAALQLLPPGLPDQLRALGASRGPAGAAAVAGGAAAAPGRGDGRLRARGLRGRCRDHRGRQPARPDAGHDHGDRGERRPRRPGRCRVYAAVLLGLAFAVNAVLPSVHQRGARRGRES